MPTCVLSSDDFTRLLHCCVSGLCHAHRDDGPRLLFRDRQSVVPFRIDFHRFADCFRPDKSLNGRIPFPFPGHDRLRRFDRIDCERRERVEHFRRGQTRSVPGSIARTNRDGRTRFRRLQVISIDPGRTRLRRVRPSVIRDHYGRTRFCLSGHPCRLVRQREKGRLRWPDLINREGKRAIVTGSVRHAKRILPRCAHLCVRTERLAIQCRRPFVEPDCHGLVRQLVRRVTCDDRSRPVNRERLDRLVSD